MLCKLYSSSVEEKKPEKKEEKPVEKKKSPSPEKGNLPQFVEVFADTVNCVAYLVSSALHFENCVIHRTSNDKTAFELNQMFYQFNCCI